MASRASLDPCWVSELITTTGMGEFSLLSLRRNVSPSMRGISMSRVRTSGCSFGILSMAISGSLATPTTSMSGSICRVSVIVLRTSAESSITSTRILRFIASMVGNG